MMIKEIFGDAIPNAKELLTQDEMLRRCSSANELIAGVYQDKSVENPDIPQDQLKLSIEDLKAYFQKILFGNDEEEANLEDVEVEIDNKNLI